MTRTTKVKKSGKGRGTGGAWRKRVSNPESRSSLRGEQSNPAHFPSALLPVGTRRLIETVNFLKCALPYVPDTMIVLGSGLGSFGDSLEASTWLSYDSVPGFASPTAPGHKGRLLTGRASGKDVLVMQGRIHVYEGHTPAECSYPVLAASSLGVKNLILTCAAGAVNESFTVGELILVRDYINLTHPGPLIGFDHTSYGERFIDMSGAFDSELLALARSTNKGLRSGVYFYMPGPQFETSAEIRAAQTLGGDLVGMRQ